MVSIQALTLALICAQTFNTFHLSGNANDLALLKGQYALLQRQLGDLRRAQKAYEEAVVGQCVAPKRTTPRASMLHPKTKVCMWEHIGVAGPADVRKNLLFTRRDYAMYSVEDNGLVYISFPLVYEGAETDKWVDSILDSHVELDPVVKDGASTLLVDGSKWFMRPPRSTMYTHSSSTIAELVIVAGISSASMDLPAPPDNLPESHDVVVGIVFPTSSAGTMTVIQATHGACQELGGVRS